MTALDRQVICVDIETAGLQFGASVLEVAAVNLETGKYLSFVPHLAELKGMEFQALQINRYFERGAWKDMLTAEETEEAYADLREMLRGNTFAGANPSFDSLRLPIEGVWHHRLLDLQAYAMGVLNLPLHEMPSFAKVCELLEVENSDPHSALGDALATAECFRRLKWQQRKAAIKVIEGQVDD